MTWRKKILIFLTAVFLAGAIFLLFFNFNANQSIKKIVQQTIPEGPVPDTFKKSSSSASLPAAANAQQASLDVPFLSQAPFGIWDPLHEDACEEASLIMVKHFLEKDGNLTSTSGDAEIRKMIQYEEQNNYGISITLEQLNQIAKNYAGMQTGRVKNNATIEDIKKELAAGRPVIVPAAGKILPNPNFRNGGPNYHMLVIKGYDKNGFITNDPGTRKGEGFRYAFNDLYNAIHDWDANNILNGQKVYLVFN